MSAFLVRLAAALLGSALYLGLAAVAWGSPAEFFSRAPFVALAVVTALQAVAAVFTRGNLSPATREDRGNRWVIAAFGAIGVAIGYLPAYTDRIGVQPGHTLVTDGIYGVVRHPSYLGLLINSLGWALAFRSGIGVLLTALLLPPLLARIRSEDALLRAQFGEEYAAYEARTSRLIPRVY
jgi:protein-S-isoprenylcysteine O-methyltransferase Ste14